MTGLWTVLSRVFGLVRDQVVAYLFGAGWAADAFFVAFRIPNLLRRLSAEGAMQAAFVPVYTQVLVEDGPEAARKTASAAFGLLAAILAAVSLLGVIFAPAVVTVIAPGFADSPEKFDLTVRLTRIVFPFIFFISLATLLMSQLNALGHFAAPAAAPVGLNLCIIGLALALGPQLRQPAAALAIGALVGGAAQLLMQLPPLIRRRALPRPTWRPGDPTVRLMARRMGPVIFGAGVYQLNLLIVTLLASLLPSGSVSYLYYADRLIQFPLGVFGVALTTAILPSLSRLAAGGDRAGFAQSTGHGLRLSLFVVLPSAVGLAVLAEPVTRLIYEHGRFGDTAARMTVLALWAYAPGLPLAALASVLVRVFNALHDTKTPALVGAASVAVNLGLAVALMGPLKHAGLALASSLASGFNLLLLLILLRRKAPDVTGSSLFQGWWRTLSLAAIMGGLLWLGLGWSASPLAAWPGWLKVALGVPGGAVVYLGLAALWRSSELAELMAAVRRGK